MACSRTRPGTRSRSVRAQGRRSASAASPPNPPTRLFVGTGYSHTHQKSCFVVDVFDARPRVFKGEAFVRGSEAVLVDDEARLL
eukprot:4788532-Prymnesium_polylepis.1